MKKYFIASSLMTALVSFTALSVHAAPPVPELKPLRYAAGHVVVVKHTLNYDPATGKSSLQSDKACDMHVNVPVYQIPSSSPDGWSINSPSYTCTIHANGKDSSLKMGASILYAKTGFYPGAPVEEIKGFESYQGFEDENIPKIPLQEAYTKELDRKNFITTSRAYQYVTCTTPVPPGAPQNPKPTIKNSSNCKVINPEMFEVIWDVQDSQ